MAVVFEQRAPLAPGFTAGAGAAGQYSRDLPSLVSLYESLARAGGGGGGGGHGGESTPFHGGRQGPTGAGGMMGGGHGPQGMSAGEATLTQAERIRIAKLQAAMSAIDADDSLNDQEKRQYKSLVGAGLDPLLYKQQQAKLRMQQEQTKELMAQHAQMAAMTSESAAERAKAFDRFVVKDPETGRPVGYLDHKGDLKALPAHELAQKRLELQQQAEARRADNSVKEWRADRAMAAKELGPEATPDAIKARAEQIRQEREAALNPDDQHIGYGDTNDAIDANRQAAGMPPLDRTQPAPAPTIPNPYRQKASSVADELLQGVSDRLEPQVADEEE